LLNILQADMIQQMSGIDLDKGSYKSLGDAVGMPDDTDKENIRKIIMRFEKKNPGAIPHTISEAKQDMKANSSALHEIKDLGLVEKKSMSSANRALVFELPEALVDELEKYIPTLFRDRKHFQWFVKNFKELMVPDRYEPRTGFTFK